MCPRKTARLVLGMALCAIGMAACNAGGEPESALSLSSAEEAPAEMSVAAPPVSPPAEAPASALQCPVNPEGTSALDCDGDATNGCEVDPYSDALNCGSCGNTCGAGFGCIQKRCCNPETFDCE